jgi:hypothetical protein
MQPLQQAGTESLAEIRARSAGTVHGRSTKSALHVELQARSAANAEHGPAPRIAALTARLI